MSNIGIGRRRPAKAGEGRVAAPWPTFVGEIQLTGWKRL
jgi:hypothetical protein